MPSNLVDFNKRLTAVAKTLPAVSVRALQKKLTLEALRRIVMKTPVDTGRARGNWQVQIGEAPEDEIDRIDKAGSSTIAEGTAIVKEVFPYVIIHITNNVPYIIYLEEGTSKQASIGMVKTTIEELGLMFA